MTFYGRVAAFTIVLCAAAVAVAASNGSSASPRHAQATSAQHESANSPTSASQQRNIFDMSTALLSLNLCKASYCHSGGQLHNWTCPVCNRLSGVSHVRVVADEDWGTQVILGIYRGSLSSTDGARQRIFIAFRGTSNIENWITDLDLSQTTYFECAGCKVHAGFFKAAAFLGPTVLQTVQDLSSIVAAEEQTGALPQIILTGHSLGAALATHMGLMFVKQNYTLASFYTFGSPRVGNADFAIWAESVLTQSGQPGMLRVTHYHDPVPHLPPATTPLPPRFLYYTHVMHEVFFDEEVGLEYKNCSDAPGHEDPHCADSLVGYSVYDHKHYLDVVTNCKVSKREASLYAKNVGAIRDGGHLGAQLQRDLSKVFTPAEWEDDDERSTAADDAVRQAMQRFASGSRK